jgi:hypothetical protein
MTDDFDIPDFLKRVDTRTHEERKAAVAAIKPTLWDTDTGRKHDWNVPAHWLDDPGTRRLLERREEQQEVERQQGLEQLAQWKEEHKGEPRPKPQRRTSTRTLLRKAKKTSKTGHKSRRAKQKD